MTDAVNPDHYKSHPSGVECIDITEHYDFCIGNALKYCWRSGKKGGPAKEIEDLKKARWYIDRKIALLEKEPSVFVNVPVPAPASEDSPSFRPHVVDRS